MRAVDSLALRCWMRSQTRNGKRAASGGPIDDATTRRCLQRGGEKKRIEEMMDPQTIIKLIALAVQVFGAAAPIVAEIKAQSGLSDDQLLAAAEQADQET